MMNGFREKFVFPTLTSVNWFPGHMAKGTIAGKATHTVDFYASFRPESDFSTNGAM